MRMKIYRMALELPMKLAGGRCVKVFAVVCNKEEMKRCGNTTDPRRIVWDLALERLERFTNANDERCMIFPDEGNEKLVRSILREKRRSSFVPSRFGTGVLSRPARLIVEDPAHRSSGESYFIQLVDLIASAAYRAISPGTIIGPEYWEALGEARLAEVNKYAGKAAGEPIAVIVWPRKR